MGQTAGLNQWDNEVYLFEETDVVQGGEAGVDNVPLKNLANRTAWLKANLGLITNVQDDVVIAANASISAALQSSLIVAFANNQNIVLTLDNANTFKHGAIIPISALCTPGNVVTINTTGVSILNPVDGDTATMHMHHNEKLVLVALTDHWKIMNAQGNFYCVGEEVKGRKQLLNTLQLRGQIVERARYPRLWAFVQTLTMYQEVIDEFSWWNNGLSYRGLFSTGDGVTTFRLPDERGMSDRMLDLGRGIDTSRTHNFPGGYEADKVGPFSVTTNRRSTKRGSGGDPDGHAWATPNGSAMGANFNDTISGGGSETIMKNIAKYNFIKF